ncbi:hypothetical protein [uncultured Tenacibaculum sp.]|uniref:hypothetical protein n=1 Tax=uncultured Tenacibaculum sp. TaxID=174713 RepID=UPI002601CA79|nr:hypothetical protein [uncultured Tenacibaculum sp.]
MNYMKRMQIESSRIGGYDSNSSLGMTTQKPPMTTTSKGGGFFDGFNLNGLLDNLLKGGMTWAQIEAAKNGKDVYVQGDGGQKENISPILVSKLQEMSAEQNKTTNEILKMMQIQMLGQNNNQPDDNKDNTLMYVGIGAGVLILLGGVIYLASNNKKKS